MRNTLIFTVFGICCISCLGCLGGMHLQETQYFSIPNRDYSEVNYFRLKVVAHTFLSKAEYHSGWYPKESVDQLFGEVTSESNTDYVSSQRKLNAYTAQKILDIEKQWLDAAADPLKGNSALDSIIEARKRVLAYPRLESLNAPYPNTISIEYNPGLERVVRHIDQKQIFVLSSDPDEIIDEIKNYSESQETTLQLQKIAEVARAVQNSDNGARLAASRLDSIYVQMLIAQLDSAIAFLNLNPSIEGAISKLEAIQDIAR